MGKLDDKVVLITGASRGQGAAEARMAAREGATVVVTDVLDDLGAEVASECNGSYVHLDVTSAASWRDAVDATVAQHGRIDGLVNNAGIFRANTITDSDEDTFRLIQEVNTLGPYLGMQTVNPIMVEQKSGSIVNISSVAGMRGQTSIGYVTSKWAVRGMTQSAARVLAPHNVRVNSVHPGAIETDMLWDLGQNTVDRLVSAVPMGRSATADEIASVVMFLLSEEASYCCGAEIVVDGGLIV